MCACCVHAGIGDCRTGCHTVRSKLKCPLFIASEMSGFSFGFIHKPVVVAAVGKWESRVLGGISKRGGKVVSLTFPRSVFSTAFGVAFLLVVRAAPWELYRPSRCGPWVRLMVPSRC